MTPAAWVMLVATWLVITGFAGRFLLAVLRTPPRGGGADDPHA